MAQDAKVSQETREITLSWNETDFRFFIALAVIIVFFIMLIIPVATSNEALFKDVAATMTGFVGTIIGYYFGAKKEQPKEIT